jgi:DNA polymerase-1
MTPFGLSKDLDISLGDAKKYIDKYFSQYPGVSKWMESVIEDCKHDGYVTTYWGRRRYVPEIHEKNKNLYEFAKRVAINTKAQGTAADIMKKGMVNLDKEFKKNNIGAQILLQIHDELIISVPEDNAKQAQEITKRVLESVVDWSVFLKITTRFGNSWKDVTK